MDCYHCGRRGTRGYEPRDDRWQCANHEACQRRQEDTSPAAKFEKIRALIDRPEYNDGTNAAYLGRRIRKVLDQ